MKVALSYFGCHRKGGVERVVYEASRYLARRKHEVHLFAAHWEEIDLSSEKDSTPGGAITYHRVPVRSVSSRAGVLEFYLRSSKMVQREPFDIINSHGVFCPLGGVHWANSVHKAWLEQSRRLFAPLSARRFKQRMNPMHALILRLERRHFRGGYRGLIAASEQVACDLNRLYAVPAVDVRIINNGFDPEEFNPERCRSRRAAQRTRLGLAEDEIAMLMVANELERKGLPVLLEAMHRLKCARLKLIVAGRANAEPYRAGIASMGLTDQVSFVGPTSDVGALHAAADFFVLPTQYEAFCLSILEALGSGLPVLTTAVPGAGDTIIPGRNGLTMQNPRDAAELVRGIEQMLDEPTRVAMCHEAASSVETYQWDRLLNRYEEYLSTLSG